MHVLAIGKQRPGLIDWSCRKSIVGRGEKPIGGTMLAPVAKAKTLLSFEAPASSNTQKKNNKEQCQCTENITLYRHETEPYATPIFTLNIQQVISPKYHNTLLCNSLVASRYRQSNLEKLIHGVGCE